MFLKPILAILIVFFINSIFVRSSFSAPWVEPDNLALRADIQLLADAGIITAPVTTYPLMWNAIKHDIMSANTSLLNDEQLQALGHVRYNFRYAADNDKITKQTVYLATTPKKITSFGNDNSDKGNLESSGEFFVGNLAGKLQANYRIGLDDTPSLNQGSDFNFDGSYLAYKLGNWIVTAGAIDRWWGPGVDTSLIMSTNARPLPAMSITRDNSDAFETPWLSWIGSWTLTAQMAQLEEERAISEALMWSARATIRPFRGLELGTSWSFQWGGEGQPSSIGDFFDALFITHECANGEETCDSTLNTQLGNHIAGYDARWSGTVLDLPYALYYQAVGEDSPDGGLVTDKAYIYGIETRFSLLSQRIFANLEYTDTQVACSGDSPTLNCYYEHSDYLTGYRYYNRTIGSTYENDAQTLVATFLIQTTAGNSWQLKFRKLQLNTDNIDRHPGDLNLGNTVSEVAQDVLQFDGQYQFIALDSRFTLGVVVTNAKFDNNDLIAGDAVKGDSAYEDGTELDAYIKWEYRFSDF